LGPAQPRVKLLKFIEDMVRNTKLRLPVMMSDCTDPYQPLEKEHKITRHCAEVLAKYGFPLLIVTKSDLVVRDIDVFKQTLTVVAVTVTTPNEHIASLIEPYAPSPERRLSALQKIVDSGLVAIARIDPILPTVNDEEKDFEKLVATLASIGVKQVTIATMKPVKGFFSALKTTRPRLYERLARLYADGSWIVGYKYLPRERRRIIIEKFRPIVLKYGLSFASCREGFSQLNTTYCDGTAYCRNLLEAYFHKG
jgi:DNA repair photolyase